MKGRRSELFHGKCYPTILSLPLHREPYIPVFHFIANLTDHQIQILTEHENAKVFPISNFLVALYFIFEILASPFCIFRS